MASLIDIEKIKPMDFPSTEMDGLDVVRYLNTLPTVDAVEVVRCRDCKRCFEKNTKRNRQKMWICMRNEVDVCVRPDDFCSYGERKDCDD